MVAIPHRIADCASENRAVLSAVASDAATWLVRDFAAAMLRLHPTGALPARAAFDPCDVPRLLPHVILVAVEPGDDARPTGFRVKVLGQSMRDAIKTDLANRRLDDFLPTIPSMRHPIEERLAVCRSGVARYGLRQPRTAIAFDFARIEYLHMPFAADGRTVDHILSAYAYEGEKKVRFER